MWQKYTEGPAELNSWRAGPCSDKQTNVHSFWKWTLWTFGIVPRVIQTILFTAFVLPVFCDVKMWKAMMRDIWRLPRSRASVRKFEVITGNKSSVEERRRVSGE